MCVCGEKQIVAAGFSNLSGGMGVLSHSVGEGLCIDKQGEWELHSRGRFTYSEARFQTVSIHVLEMPAPFSPFHFHHCL